MAEVKPSGKILGARIENLDLSRPLTGEDLSLIVKSLGAFGVLCFPGQSLESAALKAFSAQFGTLEVNVASSLYRSDAPEVMAATFGGVTTKGTADSLTGMMIGSTTTVLVSVELVLASEAGLTVTATVGAALASCVALVPVAE